VRGASKGEGLGNQFLAVIREVDAVAYVLRCFEDDDVIHVEGRVDPIADAETIETELMLADLDSLEKRIPTLERRVRGRTRRRRRRSSWSSARSCCCAKEGRARLAQVSDEERTAFNALNLLTAKPVLYVCNVDEASAATGNAHSRRVAERATAEGAGCVNISAKIEAELAELNPMSARPISPSLVLPSLA
jgi:ribosome-binding ATPase YchF (GTP1/OBG family)